MSVVLVSFEESERSTNRHPTIIFTRSTAARTRTRTRTSIGATMRTKMKSMTGGRGFFVYFILQLMMGARSACSYLYPFSSNSLWRNPRPSTRPEASPIERRSSRPCASGSASTHPPDDGNDHIHPFRDRLVWCRSRG